MKLTIDFTHDVAAAYFKLFEQAGGDAQIGVTEPLHRLLFAVRSALGELDKPKENVQFDLNKLQSAISNLPRGTITHDSITHPA